MRVNVKKTLKKRYCGEKNNVLERGEGGKKNDYLVSGGGGGRIKMF